MSRLVIEYIIDEDLGENTRNWYEIYGGVRVVYNNIILTKYTDCITDKGYHGYWIFNHVEVWMNALKTLINTGRATFELIDTTENFRFELKDDLVYFSITGTPEAHYKSFPGEGKGCPIPAKLFLKESIGMGHRFIDDITSRYKDMNVNEINSYKQALSNAECYVDDYIRSH